MARTRPIHRCSECGASAPKWAGRCDGCGEWNTLVPEAGPGPALGLSRGGDVLPAASRPLRIAEVDVESAEACPSGLAEFDRVLGGGLVPGSVTLVGGEPGIGKSTLLLQLLGSAAGAGRRCLYVSGEESASQVRSRAGRLGIAEDGLLLVSETVLPHIGSHLQTVEPEVVVVDSVQTLHDPSLGSAPGSIVQIRDCAYGLVQLAKQSGVALLLVGHVNKEGAIAGPRLLEHVVDTVLDLSGDRHHGLRVLRASKHRFGPTSEVGLFEMNGAGLAAVGDPSGLFLTDRVSGVSGSVIVPVVDGNRPLLVEVQALLAPHQGPHPRRRAQGIDQGRLEMLLAVLERRCGLRVLDSDVYALAVGGARVHDPGADAAIALAVASSLSGTALGSDLVVLGEVGLGGELRQVSAVDRRLAEAARLGFGRAIVPAGRAEAPAGLQLLRAPTLAAAVALAGLPVSIPSE